jgi:hypothetical protein
MTQALEAASPHPARGPTCMEPRRRCRGATAKPSARFSAATFRFDLIKYIGTDHVEDVGAETYADQAIVPNRLLP